MSLTSLFTQTAQHYVRSDTATDSYGNVVPGFDAPVDISGRLEIDTGSEEDTDRESAVHKATWYCQPTVDIHHLDRLVIDGNTWQVDGPPSVARSPRGAHHLEVRLRWVEGA